MIYGYENRDNALTQISDLCVDGKYESFVIEKTYVNGEGKRDPSKHLIAPSEVAPLLEVAKAGDIVITSSLVNFSPNTSKMLMTIRSFIHKGVRIIADFEHFDSDLYDPTKLQEMCNVIICFGTSVYKERSLSNKGKDLGRKPFLPSDIPNFDRYYNEYMTRKINKSQFATLIKVSRPTLNKLIKLYLEKNESDKKEKETD